jgi:hypothetical protein
MPSYVGLAERWKRIRIAAEHTESTPYRLVVPWCLNMYRYDEDSSTTSGGSAGPVLEDLIA